MEYVVKLKDMEDILKLEEKIERMRINYVKEWYAKNGLDLKGMTKGDILAVYALLMTKAEIKKERQSV